MIGADAPAIVVQRRASLRRERLRAPTAIPGDIDSTDQLKCGNRFHLNSDLGGFGPKHFSFERWFAFIWGVGSVFRDRLIAFAFRGVA